MEIAVFRIPAGLAAPAAKGGVQEGIGTVDDGLYADSAAVSHVQLHYNVAALNQIQLLSYDVLIEISDILLSEALQQQGLFVN